MTRKKFVFLFFGIAIQCVAATAFIFTSKLNTKRPSVGEAAAKTYTLKCTNFSTLVSNKYLTTTNGNKISFGVVNCSGSYINLNGYVYNTKKLGTIKTVKVTYADNAFDDIILCYGNSSNPDDTLNYVLTSGRTYDITGYPYFKLWNSSYFSENNIKVTSFEITYTC